MRKFTRKKRPMSPKTATRLVLHENKESSNKSGKTKTQGQDTLRKSIEWLPSLKLQLVLARPTDTKS
jgi:hypothetical protein